jgi:hypothetical protein
LIPATATCAHSSRVNTLLLCRHRGAAFRLPEAISAAALLALFPACHGTVVDAASSANGSSGAGASAASSSSSSSGTPTNPGAGVRFANLSTALAPFDVCWGMGSGLLAAAGHTEGLQLGEVSSYLLPAAPGAPWSLVPPGGSCGDPSAVSLPIAWPPGAEQGRVTVVPWRTTTNGTPETTAYAYLDEPMNDMYGINVRALSFVVYQSSSPGATLSVELGASPSNLAFIFEGLAFAEVPSTSPAGPLTAAGFLHTPYTGVEGLMILPNAYVGPLMSPAPIAVPPGPEGNAYGVASIFVAGIVYGGPLHATVCDDDTPGQGGLSACTAFSNGP